MVFSNFVSKSFLVNPGFIGGKNLTLIFPEFLLRPFSFFRKQTKNLGAAAHIKTAHLMPRRKVQSRGGL